MNSNKVIAERLKLCREKTNLTQTQVAKKMHTQRQIISYHENGSRLPSVSDIAFYADIYGVSADFLLGLSNTSSTDVKIQNICKKTGLSDAVVEFLSGLNVEILRSFDNPQDFADFINAVFDDDFFSGYISAELVELKQKVTQARNNISADLHHHSSSSDFISLSTKEQLEYCFYRLEREFGGFMKRYSGFNEYLDEYNAEQQRADEWCIITEREENGQHN